MLAKQQGAGISRPARGSSLSTAWHKTAAALGLSTDWPAVVLARHGDGDPGPGLEKAAAPALHQGFRSPGRANTFHLPHFLKYLLIGVLACSIDIGLFLILHNVSGFAPLMAHSISVPLSVLFSFSCNAALNFRTTDYLALRFVSFVVVAFVGYMTGAAVLGARDLLGIDANLAKILSLPLVFVVQYLLNSQISFRKTASEP